MARSWTQEVRMAFAAGTGLGVLTVVVLFIGQGGGRAVGEYVLPGAGGFAFGASITMLGRIAGGTSGETPRPRSRAADLARLLLAAVLVTAVVGFALYVVAPALAR